MSSLRKFDLLNKVAIVTGSSSGIGAAIATQFAQYGAKVTIQGRDVKTLTKVSKQIEQVSGGDSPLQIIGDLTDGSIVKKLVSETMDKHGKLDILINNAGIGGVGTVLMDDILEQYDRIMRLNVRVPIELINLCAPHLEETKGNIVNISSVAGIRPLNTAYSVSKAALIMMSQTVAKELAPLGIRVNCVNPGFVNTPFGRSFGASETFYEDMKDKILPRIPLRRLGEAQDVANLVSFLVSSDAVNITGSSFVTDGGSNIN